MSALRELSSSGPRVGQRTPSFPGHADRPMLSRPRTWRGGLQLWRKLISSSRHYAATRPAKLLTSDSEQFVEETFNDLTVVAAYLRREIPMADLLTWLRRPLLVAHPDAKALRNLLALMDALEIF